MKMSKNTAFDPFRTESWPAGRMPKEAAQGVLLTRIVSRGLAAGMGW